MEDYAKKYGGPGGTLLAIQDLEVADLERAEAAERYRAKHATLLLASKEGSDVRRKADADVATSELRSDRDRLEVRANTLRLVVECFVAPMRRASCSE